MSRLAILVAMLFLAGAAPLGAQDSATVQSTATARIAIPISIVSGTNIDFGGVAAGDEDGTIILDPDTGVATPTGGAESLAPPAAAPAQFVISGEPDTAYTLILPPAPTTANHDQRSDDGDDGDDDDDEGGVTELTVTDFTADSPGTVRVLDGQGNDTVLIGATLVVPTTAKSGGYSGQLQITVAY